MAHDRAEEAWNEYKPTIMWPERKYTRQVEQHIGFWAGWDACAEQIAAEAWEQGYKAGQGSMLVAAGGEPWTLDDNPYKPQRGNERSDDRDD